MFLASLFRLFSVLFLGFGAGLIFYSMGKEVIFSGWTLSVPMSLIDTAVGVVAVAVAVFLSLWARVETIGAARSSEGINYRLDRLKDMVGEIQLQLARQVAVSQSYDSD